MAKINIDRMAIELQKEYTAWFQQLNADIQKEAIEETAYETVETLKRISPKGDRKQEKYSQTWKYDRNNHYSGAYRFAMTVYNDKNYRLTHLLEHGHAKTGKEGGRTTAQEHIADAEKLAEETLIDKVLDIISKS